MAKQWCRMCGSRFSYEEGSKGFASVKIEDRDYYLCPICSALIKAIK